MRLDAQINARLMLEAQINARLMPLEAQINAIGGSD
jgi:hypothetical protein